MYLDYIMYGRRLFNPDYGTLCAFRHSLGRFFKFAVGTYNTHSFASSLTTILYLLTYSVCIEFVVITMFLNIIINVGY